MIRDFLTYDGDQPIHCDLCIAGAGAAGIAMALQFIDRPGRIVLLEGGGLEFEDGSQAIYQGTNVGLPYYDLDLPRLRFFGGTTNHWGGECSPLDPIDFERRAWVPYSGWPIARADLDPFYARAHPLLELGQYNYVPEEIAPKGTEFLALRADRLSPKMWRNSAPPTRFGSKYREALDRAENVDVLLHANLVEILTDGSASAVTGFRIATLDRRAIEVRAKLYVLALGGIENPRLLLNSDRIMPGGLGNQNGLVGKFFMDHIGAAPGHILSIAGDWPNAYGELAADDVTVRCALRPSPEAQERERILNSSFDLGEKFVDRPTQVGYLSTQTILRDLGRGSWPDEMGTHLWNVLTDLDGLVAGMHEKYTSTVYLYMHAEQAPNPDSKVTLNEDRDRLDLRRVSLDWRLSELDKRSLRVLARLLGEELGRLGIGRVRIEEWVEAEGDAWQGEVVGLYHHMGTTRMASDARDGVVDPNCRVFGIDNLYVAGSSVFPTVGSANPTLTIVALTLRLADHLATKLA